MAWAFLGPLIALMFFSLRQSIFWLILYLASRMESHGEPGKVHVSQATYDLLNREFACESRGAIPVKGKGKMKTWYLIADSGADIRL